VGETEVAESCPMLWVDEPAEGRGARSFGGFVGVEEVKGTKKGVGWVVEGYLLESGMVEGLNSTRSRYLMMPSGAVGHQRRDCSGRSLSEDGWQRKWQ